MTENKMYNLQLAINELNDFIATNADNEEFKKNVTDEYSSKDEFIKNEEILESNEIGKGEYFQRHTEVTNNKYIHEYKENNTVIELFQLVSVKQEIVRLTENVNNLAKSL